MKNAALDNFFHSKVNLCPICSATTLCDDHKIDIKQGLTVYYSRCTSCGFNFMNPSLLLLHMNKIYNSDEYWNHSDYVNYLDGEAIRVANAQRRFSEARPFIPAKGRLLDIGCATGFFSHVADSHGYSVIGIDPAESMISFGKDKYGLDLRIASIESLATFELGMFDVISMWGLDSHFSEMRTQFQKIVSMINPGGYLLLNYQDYSHWIRWFFPGIKQRSNVYYNFSRKSLLLLLNQLGLQIKCHKTEVQITQLHRPLRTLGFRYPTCFDDLRITIPTPSYRIVVAKKIET